MAYPQFRKYISSKWSDKYHCYENERHKRKSRDVCVQYKKNSRDGTPRQGTQELDFLRAIRSYIAMLAQAPDDRIKRIV